MSERFLSDLHKGTGYPVLTAEFGFERLQEFLLLRAEQKLRSRIGLVRKYGIKTLEDVVALLERMAGNPYVHGWVIVVNPKNARDEQTLTLLKQACSAQHLTQKTSLHFSLQAPLCVLHVEQPEESPNSWTGGLSGGIVALMSCIPKQAWDRLSVFFCSGETIISPEEMEKFRTDSPMPVLTYRDSPVWLHPALRSYNSGHTTFVKAMQSVLSLLQLALEAGELEGFLADEDIAKLVPLWRNTGRCWLLSDIAKLGLFDRRCNVGQGMEDWFQTLLWMKSLTTPTEQIYLLDLQTRLEQQEIVCYDDERIVFADINAETRNDQCEKFRKEIVAWKLRFTMFVQAGSPSFVPPEHQEFRIPI